MISDATRRRVLAAARAMIGRTDVNFESVSPSDGLVCIDIFVYACEDAGIPFRERMRLLYRQNPGAYPPDSGPPADINFPRRIRNVLAFLRALGLWYPNGPGLPGQLIAFDGAQTPPTHTGVLGEAGRAIMTTRYGGPLLAVREVPLDKYLAAHPEFRVAGYGDPPELSGSVYASSISPPPRRLNPPWRLIQPFLPPPVG